MSKKYSTKLRTVTIYDKIIFLPEYKRKIHLHPLYPPETIGHELVYNPAEDSTLDFKPGKNPLSTRTPTFEEICQQAKEVLYARHSNNRRGYRHSEKNPTKPYYPPRKGFRTI